MKCNFILGALLLLIPSGVFAVDMDSTAAKSSGQPAAVLSIVKEPSEKSSVEMTVIEKNRELAGLVSRDGKLNESIGIETLADIVTPILTEGAAVPASLSLKLGISADCDCAKLKLFRIFTGAKRLPMEISYEALRGFSPDHKTVEITLEVTADSVLHLKVQTEAKLEAGKSLEWVPASELKPKPIPKVKKEAKEVQPAAISEEKSVKRIQLGKV